MESAQMISGRVEQFVNDNAENAFAIADSVNVVASEAANRFVAFSGQRAKIVNKMVRLVVKTFLPDSESCDE